MLSAERLTSFCDEYKRMAMASSDAASRKTSTSAVLVPLVVELLEEVELLGEVELVVELAVELRTAADGE